MKRYYLLCISFLFTACMDSVQPVALEKELRSYDSVQQGCADITLSELSGLEKIKEECRTFASDLGSTNDALALMKAYRNDPRFLRAKNDYIYKNKLLQKEYTYFNLLLRSEALDSIESDNVTLFAKIADFPMHPMNYSYYRYMQKHSEVFKENKKLSHFTSTYALEKYDSGYGLVNKGKYTQGLADLSLAASMGNIKAARLCGLVYTDLYPSKALTCYRQAVEAGDNTSKYYVAKLYDDEEEYEAAFKWYTASASAGNSIAQYKLSEFYRQGKGTLINTKLAFEWLKRSADNGYATAQYHYGMHLAEKKNEVEAIGYLHSAVKTGYLPAYYPLGKIYFERKAYKQAYSLLRDADANADSMYKLGYLYEYGKGTKKNYYSAYAFYQKSKQMGNRRAQKDLERVNQAKNRLHRQQIKQQKLLEQASIEQEKRNRQRRLEAEREDKRLHAQWSKRKEEAARLKLKVCGQEPSTSGLQSKGVKIHLEGRLLRWLGEDAFIIVSGGTEYCINDKHDSSKLNKGDDVNIAAISTGTREVTNGLRQSLFDNPDESAIQKAYALDFEDFCPY